MLATLLEVAGFALVVAAAYLVALPLALLVAGVGLLLAALVLEPRRGKALADSSDTGGHRTWIRTSSVRKASS